MRVSAHLVARIPRDFHRDSQSPEFDALPRPPFHTFAACPGIPRRVFPGDLGVNQATSSRRLRPSRVNPDARGVTVTVTGYLWPQTANISSSSAAMSTDNL